MSISSFFGQLNENGLLTNQLVDHRGLAEIYVHLAASSFLFVASLVAILVIWINFGRRGQGWFALRLGILFIGIIGLGEAAEHFLGPQGHDFFHYLHMLAAPASLFYLYLAINELRMFYFDLEPKRIVNNRNLYLIALATFAVSAVLGYQATDQWDRSIEQPFLSITIIPTLVLAYLLVVKTIELYQAQNRVPLFHLSIFSTFLALIPLLAWGAVMLALAIWLGRTADQTGSAIGFVIFHTIQDLFHGGLGAVLMGSSLILILSNDTKVNEDRLVQSAKMVSLGEMAADVAVDLNNPLMSIIGYSTLMLEDKKIPAARRKDIEMIQLEASRAAKITKDLLDFSGKRRPKFQVVDVEVPLDQALSLMEGRLRQAGVEIVRNMQRPLPFVSADVDQLEQAFVNVMNNAVDAMPSGGQLEIYVTKENTSVEVSFSDNGEGIPVETIPRIFEPFFSLKPDSGTGLGLSLAKSIIQLHRGSIEVTSQVGYGTTFSIKLPAVDETESHWYPDSGQGGGSRVIKLHKN